MPEPTKKKIDPIVKFLGTNLAFAILFGLLIGLYFKNIPAGFVLGIIGTFLMNAIFGVKKKKKSNCACTCEHCKN